MLYINLGKDDVGRYAICIEELHKCGVGTCADVQTGDIVVSNGSIRMEGTGIHSLPMEFPDVPSYQVMKALDENAVSLGFHVVVGPGSTKDSFYTQTEPKTNPVCDELTFHWNSYVKSGAVAGTSPELEERYQTGT